MPWVGAAIAVATAASTMRRKGVISGAFDTGLNAVPFVGAAKNVAEYMRGRDFFPDRYGPTVTRQRAIADGAEPRGRVTRSSVIVNGR